MTVVPASDPAWRRALLLALPFALGLAMALDGDRLPGDLGDNRLNLWILEHGWRWLIGAVPSFWDAPMFAPATNVTAWSDSHLGTLPLYALARALGLAREPAFLAWLVAICALNYLAAYAVLRRLFGDTLGAVAGAYVFTFALPVMAQIGHVQLWPRFFVPLAVLALVQLGRGGERRWVVLLAAALVGQAYVGLYVAWFLGLLLLACSLAALVVEPRGWSGNVFGRDRAAWGFRLAVAVLAAIALAPLAHPYLQAALDVGVRGTGEIATMLPRPSSYVSTIANAVVWSALNAVGRTLPMHHEHWLFPGLLPIAALALAWWTRRRLAVAGAAEAARSAVLAAVATTLLVLLVSSVAGHSLYLLLAQLPPVRGFRAVTRIMLVLLFPLAMLVAAAIAASRGARSAFAVRAIAFLLVPLDQAVTAMPGVAIADSAARVAAVRARLEAERGDAQAVYAVVPGHEPAHHRQLDVMLAAQDLGLAAINGYSGAFPRGYGESLFWFRPDHCAWLRRWVHAPGHAARIDPARVAVVGSAGCTVAGPPPAVTAATRPFALADLAVELVPEAPDAAACREGLAIPVTVVNRSAVTWPAGFLAADRRFQIRVGARVSDAARSPAGGFDYRGDLPRDLRPGERARVTVPIAAPAGIASLRVEVNLVQEHVAWVLPESAPLPAITFSCPPR